ncbi:pseudouridine synthase [Geobacter sp. FeAm09]|uniref:pseudouridine synthase n=1 Tax=Geobacter sp. FeAm09 TaxID=2597769 RepID=UPI0011EDEEE8|nr:pseudouridine synthase [Geobacter sp. FeAm09]QEM69349.1 pseudouridine synthase [Geobacter sp. FeAm09]
MGISTHPSVVTMPPAERPYPSILAFLCGRFPAIPREVWEERIREGKVIGEGGHPITLDAEYAPLRRIFYFREVAAEPVIPFAEKILFRDDHLLVACKPHFLPVTPGGRYVDECLLNRLRKSTGIEELAPLHRIDRETAGLVLFSVNRESRGLYSRLFPNGLVEKSYQALAVCPPLQEPGTWDVVNRIERGEPWFRMKTVPGTANARSVIHLVEVRGGVARFVLHPHTGKTHQLRLHMSGLGFGILNDRYYPELQPEGEDNFATPLQLVARRLRFRDPLSGRDREFVSGRTLSW